MKLDHKVALITGGASGMGKACASFLKEKGLQVAVWDTQPATTADFFVACDVTSDEAVMDAMQQTIAALGVPQVCTLIPSRTEQRGMGYLDSASNTLVKDGDCTDVRMAVVPLSQFEQRGQLTLGGVSLSATQSSQSNQIRFVKFNGVVVGEIIGDGLSFESTQTIERGVRACLYMPAASLFKNFFCEHVN